jgi:5-methylthioribose kinase
LLWDAARDGGVDGELFPSAMFPTPASRKQAQTSFLLSVWYDAIGFAGMKMIRRIVGISHVADLESISNDDDRAKCERKCLLFARRLVLASQPPMGMEGLHREWLGDVGALVQQARCLFRKADEEVLTWSV